MKISRPTIVLRGLTSCRPDCGARMLFTPGSLFRVNKACSACGFRIEREGDEEFYLGSMSLNIGLTMTGFPAPILPRACFKALGASAAMMLAGVGTLLVPVLVWRAPRSWWLRNCHIFFPQHRPANGGSNDDKPRAELPV